VSSGLDLLLILGSPTLWTSCCQFRSSARQFSWRYCILW